MEDEILESLKKYPGTRLEVHPCVDGTWKLTMTKDLDGKWLRKVHCVRFEDTSHIPNILSEMSKALEESMKS